MNHDVRIHSLNIPLAEDISNQLLALAQRVDSHIPNEVLQKPWDAHIALGGVFLPESESANLIADISAIIRSGSSTSLQLGEIQSQGKYLWLGLHRDSVRTLMHWHIMFNQMLKRKQYGDGRDQHPYHPHISIAKVPMENVNEALDLVKDSDFRGIEVMVGTLYLSRHDPVSNTFPVIKEFQLRSL